MFPTLVQLTSIGQYNTCIALHYLINVTPTTRITQIINILSNVMAFDISRYLDIYTVLEIRGKYATNVQYAAFK